MILAVAPEVYDQAFTLPRSWPRWAALAFVAALTVLIALLSVGVVRRWRWIFRLMGFESLAARQTRDDASHVVIGGSRSPT